MATLVLTAVGTVLGGPIGAAIGAIAGQAIDRNIIFKPKGRQGPRLTELAVQTSSYGTPIAKLFGTMRVAGTVIWSTDLIESKARSSGGKGQPSVTNYSYAVSFAVLLSGRAISGIGRIWADGKLLRGAGGDFKSATGFRVHLGDEGQVPDPLIAAAEGLGVAPGHRGQAYVVFDHFQLADYGNRIPSLTFEVIAEAGPVSLGAIAGDISGGLVDGRGATTTVTGFSAYGDSVRGVLETLARAGGAWFAPVGAQLAMRERATAPVRIEDAGVAAAGSSGTPRTRSIAAIETVPQSLTLTHYDPARDYQTGLQRARRPGAGNRHERIELPAAIEAGGDKAMEETALALAEAARERRQVALGWSALGIAPGDTATIGDRGTIWRVSGWALEAMVLSLDLVRLEGATTVTTRASSGRVLASPDAVHGPTILHAFDLPGLDDNLLSVPRLLIAAAGADPGWRRAALLYSSDDGARWINAGSTALPAVLGALAGPAGAAPSSLRDLASEIEVTLAHGGMALAGADDDALDKGANLALLGDELIQFGHATQIGPLTWRLGRLLRGRRGTEAATGAQRTGDRFVLVDPESLVAVDLPVAAIGSTVTVLASGVGDQAAPASRSVVLSGASIRPPSPVHLTSSRDGDGIRLDWTRRSRAGWRWIDGGDAPISEEGEAYRVMIAPPGGTPRLLITTTPGLVLPAADAPYGTAITVQQLGSGGESPAATLTLD